MAVVLPLLAVASVNPLLRGRDARTVVRMATPPPSGPKAADAAARLVDEVPLARRLLAFPVAFVSASNWLQACIYTAAELRVFDALAHGPRRVADIAEEVGADAEALGRLLRTLAGQGPVPGLLVEVFDAPFPSPIPLPVPPLPSFLRGRDDEIAAGDRRYALTPMGALLREDAVGSMHPWAIFSGQELGRAWGVGLVHAVRTGQTDFGASQGEGESATFFEYLRQHPDASARFDRSMAAVSTYALETGRVVSLFDWTLGGRAQTVVDVGGGTGTLLAGILAEHTQLRGVLFDQPDVVHAAEDVLRAAGPGVRDRCTLVGGSFFEEMDIPTGADVYVLSRIIHDCASPPVLRSQAVRRAPLLTTSGAPLLAGPDAEAARVLSAVRSAMKPDSVVVCLDMLRSDRLGHEPWRMDFVDYFDVLMLVTAGGKERSRAEWASVFAQAGLVVQRISESPDAAIAAIQGIPRV